MNFLFAEVASSDIAVMVGAIVTIVGSFLAVAKLMINQTEKESKANREERAHFAEAVEKMANGMNKVADTNKQIADATKRGADEAKARNGHLADISNQNRDVILQAVTNIKEQKVEHQTVEHEHVKDKE